MRPQADYTNFSLVARSLTPKNPTLDPLSAEGQLIIQKVAAASSDITAFCGRVFVPYVDTKLFDALGLHVEGRDLTLSDDLLVLTTATNGDATVIAGGNLALYPADSPIKYKLRIKTSANAVWTYTTDWEQAISIAGTWGYHPDYTNAWGDTLQAVPSGGWTTSTTTFTATDADGADADGRERFEVGAYYKIDDEIVKCVNRNTTTNLVTIRRAQLGTTAATHDEAAVIYRYRQTPAIEEAATMLAVWYYQHRDTVTGTLQFMDSGVIAQDTTLRGVYARLANFQRKSVVGV